MSKEADKLNNEILILKSIVKDQDQKIADLEAKLAQAQKTIEIQKMSNDALIDENLDYRYDITDTAYELAKGIAEDWELGYKDEIAELKQQLRQKETDIGFLEATTCSMQEDIDYWEKQLAEKEKEIEILDKNNKLLRTVWDVDEQNKIRFAVEQLSLLKSQIIEKRRLYKGKFSEFSNGINDALCEVEEDIDNLVAELPHQHEDKGE